MTQEGPPSPKQRQERTLSPEEIVDSLTVGDTFIYQGTTYEVKAIPEKSGGKYIIENNVFEASFSRQALIEEFFKIGAKKVEPAARKVFSKGEEEKPDSPERRRFLKWTAIGAAALALGVAERSIPPVVRGLMREDVEEQESNLELKLPKLFELHEHSPNREYIKRNALAVMELPPGGYNAPLESTAPEDIYDKGDQAHARNREGSDARSIHELVFLENLLRNDERFADIASQIGAHLQSLNNADAVNKARQKFDPTDMPVSASSGDFLLLLQVLGSFNARKKALEALYALQQKGDLKDYGIEPLSEAKILWARKPRGRKEKRTIELWSLGWAEAVRPLAELMLLEAPEIWFDKLDSERLRTRIEHIRRNGISNPGTIAMLEQTETNGMSHVGDVPFITQINLSSKWFPTAEHDMSVIGSYLQYQWGLPYQETFEREGKTRKAYQYIAGSLRGQRKDENGRMVSRNPSGGAVFGQIMPINLVLIKKKYEETRTKLKEKGVNLPPLLPGSPWGMALIKYLYLNGSWIAVHGEAPDKHNKVKNEKGEYVAKGGYMVGDEKQMRGALRSWNPKDDQIQDVLDAGISYYQTFIRPRSPVATTEEQTSSTLRGSPASVAKQYRQAEVHDFDHMENAKMVQEYVRAGYLIPIQGNVDFRLSGVSHPYGRPATKLWLERFARQYRQSCGEQLVVTSLVRPKNEQPANASKRSVHPTGMAVDLRIPANRRCREYLERQIVEMERLGVIEATRERRPRHYHIAVFSRQYMDHVGRKER